MIYRNIKHFLLAISFFYMGSAAIAQTTDSIYLGLGRVHLGQPVSLYAGNLQLIGGQDTSKHKDIIAYGFIRYDSSWFQENDIPFRAFWIMANAERKITAISFTHIYSDKPGFSKPRYAKKDYQDLVTALTRQTKKEGRNKTYYSSRFSIDTGLEWEQNGVLIKLSQQRNKRSGTKSISLSWEYTPAASIPR